MGRYRRGTTVPAYGRGCASHVTPRSSLKSRPPLPVELRRDPLASARTLRRAFRRDRNWFAGRTPLFNRLRYVVVHMAHAAGSDCIPNLKHKRRQPPPLPRWNLGGRSGHLRSPFRSVVHGRARRDTARGGETHEENQLAGRAWPLLR